MNRNDRLKILVLSNAFPKPSAPNTGFYVWNQISRLSSYFDIQVIATQPQVNGACVENADAQRVEFKGIQLYETTYKTVPKIGVFMSGQNCYQSLKKLVGKIYSNFPFQMILCYWSYPDGYAAVRFAKEYGVPVIIRPRGSDVNLCMDNMILRQFLGSTLKKADRVIPVSGMLRDRVKTLGVISEKLNVIPNGIDSREFYPMDKIKCRNDLKIWQNKKVILFVGNLLEVKGIEYLLGAIKNLDENKRNDIVFYILGSGKLQPQVENLRDTLKHVQLQLVGDVPHDKLVVWMNAADILCLSSIHEGWPNVLMESLACGTPVVSTRVGGVPEIINNESLGILVPSSDSKALSEAIEKALSTQWDKNILINRVSFESWDIVADKLRKECLSLVEN